MKNETHLLTYNGRTMTLAMWSRETGIPYSTLYARKSQGLSDREVLHGKVNPVDPPITIGSWTYPLSVWCRWFKVKPTEAKVRLKKRLPHEHVIFGEPNHKPHKDIYIAIGNRVERAAWWSIRTGQRPAAVARRLAAGASPVDAVFHSDTN